MPNINNIESVEDIESVEENFDDFSDDEVLHADADKELQLNINNINSVEDFKAMVVDCSSSKHFNPNLSESYIFVFNQFANGNKDLGQLLADCADATVEYLKKYSDNKAEFFKEIVMDKKIQYCCVLN